MSPVRAPATRWRLRCPAERGQSGESLVELSIAISVFAIVLSMVVVIVSTIIAGSNQGFGQGQATDAAQRAVQTLQPYLAGIVSPENAYTATQGAASPLSDPESASPADDCWAGLPPDPQDSSSSGVWSGDPTSIQSAETGIIVAHDFNLEFCGIPPGAADQPPHVYEIEMVCPTRTTPYKFQAGNCTVEVIDYGTTGYSSTCAPSGIPTECADYNPADPTGAAAGGTVVASIANVWCDLYCQNQNGGSSTFGEACSSWTADGGSAPNGATSCADATPPLFTYFPSSAAAAPGSTVGALNAESAPMDLASPADAEWLMPDVTEEAPTGSTAQNESGVATIELNLTIMDKPNDAGAFSAHNSGTAVTVGVGLPGLSIQSEDS